MTGAILAIISYSSLAVGAAGGHAGGLGRHSATEVALGLVVGANLGSGLLAVLTTPMRSTFRRARCRLGNLLFRMVAATVMIPVIGLWHTHIQTLILRQGQPGGAVPPGLQHDGGTLLCLPITGLVATAVGKILRRGGATRLAVAPAPPGTPRPCPRPRWPFPARHARPCTWPIWWNRCATGLKADCGRPTTTSWRRPAQAWTTRWTAGTRPSSTT